MQHSRPELSVPWVMRQGSSAATSGIGWTPAHCGIWIYLCSIYSLIQLHTKLVTLGIFFPLFSETVGESWICWGLNPIKTSGGMRFIHSGMQAIKNWMNIPSDGSLFSPLPFLDFFLLLWGSIWGQNFQMHDCDQRDFVNGILQVELCRSIWWKHMAVTNTPHRCAALRQVASSII